MVSRERCIFPDYESALEYQCKRNGQTPYPMTEFIVPTRPEEVDGKPLYTPLNPRIILMLIEEPRPEAAPQETTSEAPADNESQD